MTRTNAPPGADADVFGGTCRTRVRLLLQQERHEQGEWNAHGRSVFTEPREVLTPA